ncbi:transcription initiation factor TFIID subunit 9-like [Anopheles albimanus]|uniref:transcription initiation factor TFIID subunit 9-like n=1 Tax=Anopheles albimanus TaxID=7167 RepID=UPI0016408886|nr:transcription initiation factor TFIID subunit 9-like [Anopheles albimanus]
MRIKYQRRRRRPHTAGLLHARELTVGGPVTVTAGQKQKACLLFSASVRLFNEMEINNIEREKSEKVKISNQVKHIPKDAQVVMSILKELGVQDYEPRVINQLLEFTYRYVTCILDDAKIYANHARKKVIELDDVKLATQMILDKAFTGPPPRDVLLEIARNRNVTPLPLIKTHCGLRLPPDRYCLSACNYKLRAAQQPKRMNKSALENRSSLKATKVSSGAGSDSSGGSVKRPSVQSTPKTQVVTIPKPVFKLSEAPKVTPAMVGKPPTIKTTVSAASAPGGGGNRSTVSGNGTGGVDIKMEIDDHYGDGGNGSNKRKREEDDFEIVP